MVSTKCLMQIGLCIALAAATVAARQGDTRIDTQVNSGANTQVGSSGYNPAILPGFVANNADLYVTGNITGGRAFRAFSPVADSTAFRATTPSSSLSRFERDSISYLDLSSGRNPYLPSPYYSRSRTATTYGGLSAGLNDFGALPSAGLYSRQTRTAAYTSRRYGMPYAPDLTRSLTSPPVNSIPMTSPVAPTSIFAQPVTAISAGQPNAAPWPVWLSAHRPADRDVLLPRTATTTQTDTETPGAFDPVANSDSIDLVRRSGLSSIPIPTDAEETDDRAKSTTSFEIQQDTAVPLTHTPSPRETLPDVAQRREAIQDQADADTRGPTDPLQTEPSTDPGADIPVPQFQPTEGDWATDVQSAYRFITQVTQREAQIMADLEGRPTDKKRYEQDLQNAWRLFTEPVTSFSGTGDSKVQQYILTAETLLRDGKYYQARSMYERARSLDRRNPLVLLGLGHALLAAGEYYSAAVLISRAVELFPAMAYLRFDLNEFVHQPDLLEIRRADLERRLEQKEDLRFRFLLGYAEFYSGLPQFGMPNLQRAAQSAPVHSGIARLYQILRQKQRADQN